WEHDKNPACFFEALETLRSRGVDFRISVIGERFRDSPDIFDEAKQRFDAHIDRWGYQNSRRDYEAALREADVIISTANHEFFGISVVEAVAAGAYPLLPRRLSYPEILARPEDGATNEEFFYEGSVLQLASKLAQAAELVVAGDLWQGEPLRGVRRVARFSWERLAPTFDEALDAIVTRRAGS
ncbi:MAG: glycosyltransferase, partial [Ralstonia sp.]